MPPSKKPPPLHHWRISLIKSAPAASARRGLSPGPKSVNQVAGREYILAILHPPTCASMTYRRLGDFSGAAAALTPPNSAEANSVVPRA